MRYVRKRQAHLEGNANLVEVDLLRGGTRMEMLDEWPNSPYYLLVCRRERAPKCSVWPTYYTRPLPEIPAPLTPPDADVGLSLQKLIDHIYARLRYELEIDYAKPCRPPLDSGGTEWLAGRLRA